MNKDLFSQLHQQEGPLLICNVWDAASAKMAEKQGFQAMGTSSAALANMLGYNDGEELTFAELLFVIQRIAKATSIPLSVDIEAGFSDDPKQVATNIEQLVNAGVVGINIEDSKVNDTRSLMEAETFSQFLSSVKAELDRREIEVFINVRTDPFLLGLENSLAETIKRAELYQAAGADGLFVPCITDLEDMKSVVAATKLPVNVMCMPDLPDFSSLQNVGVKRISMGNFVFDKVQSELQNLLLDIKQNNSFTPVF